MSIFSALLLTPFYPHWLHDLKMRQANDHILKGIHGVVLEVGAGNGKRKLEAIAKYKKIVKYIATDHTTWDGEFGKLDTFLTRFPYLGILIDRQKRITLDKTCDALQLPFKSSTFDYHISYEVLEHVADPVQYFSEAKRVLKNGGKAVISVPYLYRMHGGEPDHTMDYFRYSFGFFYHIKKTLRFNKIDIYVNTGGTTVASIINQWLIRRIVEANIVVKPLYTVSSLIIFPVTNLIGYVIDIYPDERFATRFHISLTK
ncbi:MAG TPA: class I SAM-dependent methyltransferase [Patescibacteria group bacterium]|nr:class I SAM-dependent methyltransferase [Patescibacteria group bacterium]